MEISKVLLSSRNVIGFGLDRFVSVSIVSSATAHLGFSDDSGPLFACCAAATVCVLVALAVLSCSTRGIALFDRPSFPAFCATAVVAALAVLTQMTVISPSSFFLLFVGTTVLGAGSAGLFVRWGMIFSEAGSKTMLVEVSVAYLLGFILSALCASLSVSLNLIALVLATIVNCWIVTRSAPINEERATSLTPNGGDLRRSLVKVCLGVALLGLAFGCISQTLGLLSRPHLSDAGNATRLACEALVVLAVAILARFSDAGLMAKTYRAAFLIIVLGCLAILAIPEESILIMVVVYVGSMALVVVGMSLLFNLAHRAFDPSARIISLGTVSFVMGDIIFRIVDQIFLLESTTLATPAFHFALLAALIVLTYTTIFTERDIMQIEALENVAVTDAPSIGLHEAIGAKYGLTKRENEILKYLLSGRSSRRIQEELFISESTVHTHVRHIYQKLEVHSKQELLDLAERVRGA